VDLCIELGRNKHLWRTDTYTLINLKYRVHSLLYKNDSRMYVYIYIYKIYIICNIYKFLSCVAKCKCYYLACARSDLVNVVPYNETFILHEILNRIIILDKNTESFKWLRLFEWMYLSVYYVGIVECLSLTLAPNGRKPSVLFCHRFTSVFISLEAECS
jgi:hypothetical protein